MVQKSDQVDITIGCVILAGGKSTRMGGENKALLKLGDRTFLERIASELSDFEERLLSGGGQELADMIGFRSVPDQFPGCGPLGGIYSALSVCKSGALLVLPCDMPYFRKALAEFLKKELTENDDGIICEDASNRLQPLCGIYTKKCIPVLKECLEQGRLKMLGLQKDLRIRAVQVPSELSSESIFHNMNSKEDLPQ